MLLYDSVKKEKLEFIPKTPDIANIYLCGPTVYDYAHLGHARASICFDLLKRVLLANGYKVNFARNYTDIDDKIIKRSDEENIPILDLTKTYIKAFEKDMSALNVLTPELKPHATSFIKEIIEYIIALQGAGYTYTLEDGVYFDTSKDGGYFSLSGRMMDQAQSRLSNEADKKNESDFVLWKFDPKFYDAPFGKGRPGWHSECVAMIDALFKDKLDIHAGGIDLLFPHHENEAAQCRCAKQTELASFWLHNGFVNINNEKMSKSLGNSFFVKDVLRRYQGEVLRFYLFSIHYRAHFNYEVEELENSKKRLDRFYRLKKRLDMPEIIFEQKKLITKLGKAMLKALEDDLNISKSLSILDEFITEANILLDKDIADEDARTRMRTSLMNAALLLGVGMKDPKEYFSHNISDEEYAFIEEQIKLRKEAKANKDYATADKIRDLLQSRGITLMDKGDEILWEKA